MPTWSTLTLQNSNSPLIEQLIFFHDNILIILSIITILILFIIISITINKSYQFNLTENQNIELTWTILPRIFLILIAFPSLQILYLIDEFNKPLITLKIRGNQWYWTYEYTNFKKIEFNSYIINNNSIFRLLDTDNRIILPFNVQIQALITSLDTIHAWTIPSLGVKIDALPGRLNQCFFSINRPGIYFGQCSEICGINHRFIPIRIESINLINFLKWIKISLNNLK